VPGIETDRKIHVGGADIVYDRVRGSSPGIVFLGGFASQRKGTKAEALYRHALATGRSFVRFDYSGHGDSGGRFEEATVGRWLAETLAVLDEATEGPQVLVGSSMGGWMALLAARERPERVAGLVTVACAADFTAEVVPGLLTEEARRALSAEGVWYAPSEYGEAPVAITSRFLEEAERWLLLDKNIPVACPVRLLHGLSDGEVPWGISLRVAERLASRDVVLELVKGGDHRLSTDADLARLVARVEEVLALAVPTAR
jgi:pimeloyl-ACP methyl ester carboxylesterase